MPRSEGLWRLSHLCLPQPEAQTAFFFFFGRGCIRNLRVGVRVEGPGREVLAKRINHGGYGI